MSEPLSRSVPPAAELGSTHARAALGDRTYAMPHADPGAAPKIPGYEIEAELGRGGMGVVYLARDLRLQRQVAIKTLSVTGRASQKLLDRFRTESQAVAILQHPNIGQVYVADEYDGQPFFVMEYIPGPNLGDQTRGRPQEPRAAANLVATLADAIQYCHERNILHRDLKPSNVLMVDDRTPKIVDFGLAKSLTGDSAATRTGEILGTPGYMAPEQASGVVRSLGPECDVYGLGAILYKLTTGRPPFDAPDPVQTVMQVLTEDPVPPRQLQKSIPRDVETICLKCLAKQPTKRYGSAAELAADLRRFCAGQPIVARPAGPVERAVKWIHRRPSLAALIGSIIVMIAAAVVGLTWHNRQLGDSLARSKRLVDYGSELSMWVIQQHLNELKQLRGSTEVQLHLVSEVQDFLEKTQQETQADALFKRKIAASYEQVANVLGSPSGQNLGRSQDALKMYRRAIRLLREAHRMEPNDFMTRAILARCLLALSDVITQTEGVSSARKWVREAEQIVKDLPQQGHEDAWREIQIQLAKSRYWLAFGSNRWQESLRWVDRVLQLVGDRKPLSDPLAAQYLAWVYENRGRAHYSLGDYARASEDFAEWLTLERSAAAVQPMNAIVADRLATALLAKGDAVSMLGDNPAALALYEEALPIRRELLKSDPSGARALQTLSTVLERIGKTRQQANQLDLARDALTESLEIGRRLVVIEPRNRDFQRQLWIQIQALADISYFQELYDQAQSLYEESLAITERLISVPNADLSDSAGKAQALLGLGNLYFQRWLKDESILHAAVPEDHPAYREALSCFQKSLAVYAEIESRAALDANQRRVRDSIHKLIGRLEEAARMLKGTPPPP